MVNNTISRCKVIRSRDLIMVFLEQQADRRRVYNGIDYLSRITIETDQ